MKTLANAEEATPAELRTMEPPQVDELFAAVWDHRYELLEKVRASWNPVFRAVGARQTSPSRWDMPLWEAEQKAYELAAEDSQHAAAKALTAMNRIKAEIATLDNGVLAKLEDEFTRRGGWTRAYLAITNGKGHVHKTDECSTCHNGEYRTRLHWMIDYSGKSEKEIIEAAGERACSVCYKDAPTSIFKLPTKMFSRDEIEAQKAREEREEKRRLAAAKKAEKAIFDADGGPLQVYTWTQRAHRKQTRQGIVDVPEREFFDTLNTLHAARGWLTNQFEEWRGNGGGHRDLDKVATAVALKEGKDVATVIEEAKKRAERRRR